MQVEPLVEGPAPDAPAAVGALAVEKACTDDDIGHRRPARRHFHIPERVRLENKHRSVRLRLLKGMGAGFGTRAPKAKPAQALA